ncbi:MAG: hypothetical protein JNL82_16050 [Myxococcales bacterium]|nr:hypothetical protein [Myxococcales bacterium]
MHWSILSGYLCYFVAYFVLKRIGALALAAWLNIGCQLALDVSIIWIALRCARAAPESERVIFSTLAVTSVVAACSDSVYGYSVNILGMDTNTDPRALWYFSFYLLFLIGWAVLWGRAVLAAPRLEETPNIFFLVAAVLLTGLAGVFFFQYWPTLELLGEDSISLIFHVAFTAIQLLTTTTALITFLLIPYGRIALLVFGYTILVATDFILRGLEAGSALTKLHPFEVTWSLGQAFVLVGCLRALEDLRRDASTRTPGEEQFQRVRTRAAATLATTALIPSLLILVFSSAITNRQLLVALGLITVTGLIVAISRVARIFELGTRATSSYEGVAEPTSRVWKHSSLGLVLDRLRADGLPSPVSIQVHMAEKMHITKVGHAHGIVGGEVSTGDIVGSFNQASTGAETSELVRSLKQLQDVVSELCSALPSEQRDTTRRDFESFATEAQSKTPRPGILQAFGDALIQTAGAIQKLVNPIREAIGSVIALISAVK